MLGGHLEGVSVPLGQVGSRGVHLGRSHGVDGRLGTPTARKPNPERTGVIGHRTQPAGFTSSSSGLGA